MSCRQTVELRDALCEMMFLVKITWILRHLELQMDVSEISVKQENERRMSCCILNYHGIIVAFVLNS